MFARFKGLFSGPQVPAESRTTKAALDPSPAPAPAPASAPTPAPASEPVSEPAPASTPAPALAKEEKPGDKENEAKEEDKPQ
ncbi:hypothetical protein GOODEAATRI_029286, partial [Goodea atripinnis]